MRSVEKIYGSSNKPSLFSIRLDNMGDSLEIYRVRIGLFGPGRGYGRKSISDERELKSRWELSYRMIATFFVLGSVLLCCRMSMNIRDLTLNDIFKYSEYLCIHVDGFDGQVLENVPITSPVLLPLSTGTITANTLYLGFHQRLLVLSADIESNPGPVSETEITIIEAIKASEERVLGEIRGVKLEINNVKQELAAVKGECVQTKLDVNELKKIQRSMVSDIKQVQTDVKCLEGHSETMQLDIDELNDMFQSKNELLNTLELNVENLERESRKGIMRVFGLPEETKENTKALVTEKVLKLACPDQDWEPDDLQRAFRAGEPTNDQPRMVVVAFRYSDDKFRIYAGRETLRNHGIRVSDDLTLRQRKQLKALKMQGKTGYFYKGELKIRPERSVIVNSNGKQWEPDSKRRRFHSNNTINDNMEVDMQCNNQPLIDTSSNTITNVSSDNSAQSDGNSTQ